MDSDEEGDERVISLTHLLFGNINADGQLENDFLDPESIRHLHQLRQLGIGTQLKEITDDVADESSTNDFIDTGANDECSVKSPSAIDYSDINELADEPDSLSSEEPKSNNLSPQTDALEDSDLASSSYGENNSVSDADLMPPPSLPTKIEETNFICDASCSTSKQVEIRKQENVAKAPKPKNIEKKLDTPLAAMLPSKYKNMDVKKLFPEFRHGQVLRFSRLFGPGKPTSLPQIWRGVKNKKKKSTENSDEHKLSKLSLEESKPPSPPKPEDYESDDEIKFMKPEENKRSGSCGESSKTNELSPGFAAWRYGPAQLWYDMLKNVPESGEGFDYGFKLKETVDSDEGIHEEIKPPTTLDDVEDEFPPDAYFMISQCAWEEDVIWNGEDVKHKVLSKLNDKNNAAGWVPSSLNRTASAFSQQGENNFSKTIATTTGTKTSSQQGTKSGKASASRHG